MSIHEVVAWLYAPASRPELFPKAHAAADGVVVDLEDAVVPSERDRARSSLASLVELTGKPVVVRVNRPGSMDLERDLAAVGPLVHAGAVHGIRVPKVDAAEDLDAIGDAVAGWPVERPIIAQLESARAVADALRIAGHPTVGAIMLGEADLRADLGLPRGAGDAGLGLARQTVVMAARAQGRPAPVGSAFTDTADADGLATSSRDLRELGFVGRSCIHPRQVPVVRAAFQPAPSEVAWARDVLRTGHAARAHGSAAAVAEDGTFVDPAIEREAREILRRISAPGSGSLDTR
ncbi:HpcH/HpaI aldolase/citrate lyase family protein [Pseudolysinimonas sp.]|uniref:HpcH/HpaI aldolase/citrate lyase family protein n=1 Tax=Pseudolysinimonas sp. TaxID=2680009 RepID=UPI003F801386